MMPMIAEVKVDLLVTSEPSDSGVSVNNNKTQLFTNTNNTSESNEIVTAPNSLPLTGKIDNVIAPENPCGNSQWKRTICSDGLIRYSLPVNDENVVIVDSRRNGSNTKSMAVITNPLLTRKRRQVKRDWIEIAKKSVFPIMCNNIKAELHKDRFGSGSLGQCISCNGIWYTPNEFEVICGGTTTKNWKRSIKFEGRRIQELIDNKILVPHPVRCTCVNCCRNESSVSPIGLFAPNFYQNSIAEPNEKKAKIENVNSNMNTIHKTNKDSCSKKAQQKIAESPDANAEFPPGVGGVLKRLNEINKTLVRLMEETKHCVEEVTIIGCEQMKEKTVSSTPIVSSTEPAEASLLNVDGTEAKACANCNRKTLSECSFCRRTPYCSSFCENKDWGSHWMDCLQIEGSTPSTDQYNIDPYSFIL